MNTSQIFPAIAVLALALLVSSNAGADELEPVADDAAELSIAPLDHVEYPSDRPRWIEESPQANSSPLSSKQSKSTESKSDDVISIVVVSPPQPTPEAAAEMMEVMAKGAVENYIDQQAAALPESIDTKKIVVEMDWIRNELITRRYDGEVQSGDQTEYESACLMQLKDQHQVVLQKLIQNHHLMHRLGVVGILALGGFLALVGGSILFGGLASRQQRRSSPASENV